MLWPKWIKADRHQSGARFPRRPLACQIGFERTPISRRYWKSPIEVLHAIQGMANQLAGFDFYAAPQDQRTLTLANVEISVRADLIVHGLARGREQIGAAILRMTQDDADTEAARSRRQDMGFYVATLARLHLDANLPSNREAANRLCLSIDVQHGEAFACPNSNTRRRSDLENACRFIGAMWLTL